MTRYAAQTGVSSEKSRSEIERTLIRYGASVFAYGWQEDEAIIQFTKDGRTIRFRLPMPDKSSREFTHTPVTKERRTDGGAYLAWEQGCRSRWRALALVIKAKLEAVAAGISVFEEEFLSYVVVSDGLTIGQHMLPKLDDIVLGAPMLPALGAGA